MPLLNNIVDAILDLFAAATPVFNNIVDAALGFFAAAPLASSNLSPTVLNVIFHYNIVILIYFLALNFFYIFLLLLATDTMFYYKRSRHLRSRNKEANVLTPSIAIIAPAYNEALTIVESARALLYVDYPELEIIVINDGSKDQTLALLKDAFNLFPAPRAVDEKIPTKPVREIYKSAVDGRLTVIDKENGGKADSLNAGINYSRSRLFCAIDADSLIEKDALNRLMQFYIEREAKVIALGGVVRIANDCRIENGEVIEARVPKKFLPAMQAMEYIRAFLCGRAGGDKLNSLLVISGAFGLFERKSVIDAGGTLSQRILPFANLAGVNLKSIGQFGYRLFTF